MKSVLRYWADSRISADRAIIAIRENPRNPRLIKFVAKRLCLNRKSLPEIRKTRRLGSILPALPIGKNRRKTRHGRNIDPAVISRFSSSRKHHDGGFYHAKTSCFDS